MVDDVNGANRRVEVLSTVAVLLQLLIACRPIYQTLLVYGETLADTAGRADGSDLMASHKWLR